MPYFVRNKLAETLVFRGGYVQIPADGSWKSVSSLDVAQGLFEDARARNMLEICEAEEAPTDVLEIIRPKMNIITTESVAQGLSLEEFLAWKKEAKQSAESTKQIGAETPVTETSTKTEVTSKSIPSASISSLSDEEGLSAEQLKEVLTAKNRTPEVATESTPATTEPSTETPPAEVTSGSELETTEVAETPVEASKGRKKKTA